MIENYHLKIGNKYLKTEVDHLKALLTAAEHREKLLLKKQPAVSDRWLCNSVHYTDPEAWDRYIWYDSGDDETSENSDSKSDEGYNEICTTVHSIPWSLTELAKLQEKYSRKPENSEVEIMFIQTPDSLDINGNIEGDSCHYKLGENDSLSPSNSPVHEARSTTKTQDG